MHPQKHRLETLNLLFGRSTGVLRDPMNVAFPTRNSQMTVAIGLLGGVKLIAKHE